MKDRTPWYYGKTENPRLVSSDSGWVNSIALIGQLQLDLHAQLIKQEEFRNQLVEDRTDRIAQKYHLTRDQLNSISVEAFQKDWPISGVE